MQCFNLLLSTFFVFFNAYLHAQADARAPEREDRVLTDNPEGLYFGLTPGTYSYRATNNIGKITGLYLLAAAEDLIKIAFTDFDVPCGANATTGSLVQYTDGWELNGQVFPVTNKKVNPNETEFCSDNSPGSRTFVSLQNGALLTFRIFEVGKGFTINVEHEKHPSPCNVIYNGEPYVILRNHGSKVNCSYWFINKLKVKLNSYSIGDLQLSDSLNKCSDSSDRIEIGGTNGLDSNDIEVLDTICNESKSSDDTERLIDCPATIVKLVSSGAYENYVNVTFEKVNPEESVIDTKYRCTKQSNGMNVQ